MSVLARATIARGSGSDTRFGIKTQWWSDNHEIHSAAVTGPYPHGEDRFAVRFEYDITNKLSGQRMQMDEVGLFTVDAGKIVKEEFFYDMG